MITVYHGSYAAIEEINLTYSSKKKDFGRGFYVTNLPEQARAWASRVGKGRGVVTEFEYSEFMTREMKMKVLRFEGYTDEWLDFVVLNRRNDNDIPAHDYDIVEGPVADDRVIRTVNLYLDGTLSRSAALIELQVNKTYSQYVFVAQTALNLLAFIGSEEIPDE